ncbi:YebC/PmpR family DNA-binding transcriptional regulator [Beggiatoa leptomitoformis]|uniref:Probable transcriptional regulatory protein BLE401_01195 n=1 Tax=Beggiatoa leptomitoformis TaxID=288004 RepID=A0A2N9YAH7_9GAMM|nr:YebC/PmpR family DNA-binding transcriptional regulator [Beggiatoa leptomitoformis]ALG67155.1 YebC/PmpR family DNA-binding transcriptional regulator [Beggiatoa leptomitoformis]AUI67444.1 YebC/PmpR family DNA-binding transcriptional regulator [Beggiatoa leptomitoformis]
MAGHSKWANIQHRKGAQDAKKAKVFTKFIREITVSARMGGGDANANPRLRLAVDKALTANMPKDTIERAIKRGAGAADGENYEEVRYEGYGAGGIAVIVDCMTDNRNRTVSEVRHAFSKCGGNLGTDGSVAYMFEKIGLLTYPTGSNEDKIMEAALEAGAQDVVKNEDNSIDVITDPSDLHSVKVAMEKAKLVPESAEITMRAGTSTSVDLDTAEKIVKLLDMLEDLDDVQKVYSNADFSDEVMAALA